MDGLRLTVDVSRLNDQLKAHRMTTPEARRSIRNGLAAAGRIIRNEARANLKTVSGKHGIINYAPLLRFVKLKVYNNGTGVRIDILGGSTRRQRASLEKKGIKDLGFVLKFFDLGTKLRYNSQRKRKILSNKRLKKKRYTGRIEESGFFQKAVKSKGQEAQDKLQGFIEKQIERIARRR